MSSVALAVCTASDFTSEATTEKPRPASPARAASMVALSASRLVCPGDVADQFHHVADLLRGFGEPGDLRIGRFRLVRRHAHHSGGLVELARDLADRVGELVGRGRGGRHVGRGLVRGVHARWSARCEVWSDAREQLGRGRLHRGGALADGLEQRSRRVRGSSGSRRRSCRACSPARPSRRAAARSLRCSVTSSWVATQPPAGHWRY